MKRPIEIQTEHIPEATAEMARRRVQAIVRHCCLYESNIIEAIALSCYLQGIVDGTQVAAAHPETVALFRDESSVGTMPERP